MSRIFTVSLLVMSVLAGGSANAQTRNPFLRPSAQEAPLAAPVVTSPEATGAAVAPGPVASPKPVRSRAPRSTLAPDAGVVGRAEPPGLALPPALPPALVAGAKGPAAAPGALPPAVPPLNAESSEPAAGGGTVAEPRAFLTREEIQSRRSRCPAGVLAAAAPMKAGSAGDLLVLKLTTPGCVQGVSASDEWVSARLTSAGTIELEVEPNEEPVARRTVLVVATPTSRESVTIQQAPAVK